MKTLPSRLWQRFQVWMNAVSGREEDKTSLALSAHQYWNDGNRPDLAQDSHWRGHGHFSDDRVWLRLGQGHLALLQRVLMAHALPQEHLRVLEWGCGGGMNAVHFARGASHYYGVDISQASLNECERQMALANLPGFVPVLIQADQPRTAVQQIGTGCDLFVCTYVIELLPTEAHALELLDLAHELLVPGAHALIQLRYSEGGMAQKSRPWGYAQNMAHNVTFRIEDFEAACQARGFQVLAVEKQEQVPELNERNYAYFVLQR
jgi:cyclopropane fatty-acyl-phospholipid synthase-like methyltransferase